MICLLSALRFHGVTTQSPFEVWIAIENKARAPTANEAPLRVVRFSGLALESSIETHVIDGVPTGNADMSVVQPSDLPASVRQRLLNIAKRGGEVTLVFADDAAKQTLWKAFLRKNALPVDNLTFPDIIKSLHDLMMPPTMASSKGLAFNTNWPLGGSWHFLQEDFYVRNMRMR